MKKTISIMAVALLAGIFLSGCASTPIHVNLTGNWNYDYQVTGLDKVKTGSMVIHQNDFNISGTANDADGQFVISGIVSADKFTIKGNDAAKGRDFEIKATLGSDCDFKGTYQTNQGTSGSLSATRQ